MLRLPAALLEDISLRAGQLAALSQTCTALWRVLNQPETQLRFYLAAQRRRRLLIATTSSSSYFTAGTQVDPQGSIGDATGLGPATVYELLTCRARPADAQGTLRLLQLMLACGSMIQVFPAAQQTAVQHMLAATDSKKDVPRGVALIMAALPHAEHCLLHFCAASGHLQLVKVLLPTTTAPVRLHGVLHYVKTSAFLAAAAGGHVAVLMELLSAGAARWACQLPGASLTSSALDLAALGGHMEAMQLLSQYVANPSPYFLTAAADSGSGAGMEWALQQWFGQFSAVTAFSRGHVQQLHDALKVSCQRGHVSAVRQLLAALHRINNDDCCVLALSYASSTSNTDAIQAVLESPQLPVQLSRGGPKLLSKLAQAVASCVRIAILRHCRPALDLLLHSLASSSSPIAAARPLLGPHMRFIFDQAGQSGNGPALQLLLLLLPEHYEALGVSALEAALSEGHADVAATIKTLLLMQGPDPAAAAAALSPEGDPGLAKASLSGAFKGACVRGDTAALHSLLHQGPAGPDDNMQLLMLRLAAGAGKEAAVRLLLDAFGAAGPRLESNLKAVCRGAVHAGQLQLLQALAADGPNSALLSHITSQPEALAEYLRAALLCGQVGVAAWLVPLAHQQQELELVRSTLSSLLTTSRWELLNAGKGIAVHDVVFELLKRLAAQSLAASSSSSRSSRASDSSSNGSCMSVEHGTAAADNGDDQPGSAAAEGDAPAVAVAATAAPVGLLAPSSGAGSAVGEASSTGMQQHSNLGKELLQPQLLGQLLHVSQGYPWRLLTVVQLVDWWGLDTGAATPPHILQQQEQEQHDSQVATAAELAGMTLAPAPLQHTQVEQQQQQQSSSSGQEGGLSLQVDSRAMPRSSSSSASTSSNDSAQASSSVTSASSGSGDAACDVVSPCTTCPGGAAGAGTATPSSSAGGPVRSAGRMLQPANSMEVGSLQSDDCQHATSNWLDDLIHKNAAGAGSGSAETTSEPQQEQQQQQPAQPTDHVLAAQDPAVQLPSLAKEWGGSWQQLTGQVAQLHMSTTCSPQQQQHPHQSDGGAVRKPRQSFDYEQHMAQQLRRRQQQQQGGSSSSSSRAGRRESSPGRSVRAQRHLRHTLSQPLAQAPRCPVHPYMQQGASQHGASQHGASQHGAQQQ